MSSKAQVDLASENGKPARGSTPPVIRRQTVAEEDPRDRLLKRQVPAWVISGGVHVVLVGIAALLFSGPVETKAKPDDKIVTTEVAEQEEQEKNLENEDLGFDPDLKAATEADREEPENVEAPVKPDEPIGDPSQVQEMPAQTFAPPGLGVPDSTMGAIGEQSDTGKFMQGEGGGASTTFTVPGMRGRSGATKDKLLKAGGGNSETEAAVARGLAWLAKQQRDNGSWVYDGGSKNETVAATGMSLLPFLAAGQTHRTGLYRSNVGKGLAYLMGQLQPTGQFRGAGMYAQGIGTIALCEAAGMTLDPDVKGRAQLAVNYIVRAQGSNGSWGYQAGRNGDTSIVGWQVQALMSGKLANLSVPDSALKNAAKFLTSVQSDSGSGYGYASPGKTPTLSAVGLLCRQYMEKWGPKNPALGRGVDYLKKTPPTETHWDMYYYYYATQVVHFYEGPAWHEFWNPRMRKMLVDMQEKTKGPNYGSWKADNGHIGGSCGRLGTTCLAILTLEVYYRHLPLYKRDNGGLSALEM